MFPIPVFAVLKHGERNYACYFDGDQHLATTPELDTLAIYVISRIRKDRPDFYKSCLHNRGLCEQELIFRAVPGLAHQAPGVDEVHFLNQEETDRFLDRIASHLDTLYAASA